MENIFKHLSNHDEKSNPGGVRLRILEASREVGRPVFFAVLIIIVVFAPLFTLEGVEGKW
jgi:cobalt-zinc-cadmium resistance protein CzcA